MEIVITKAVSRKMENNPQFFKDIIKSLDRFQRCDWGELVDADIVANNIAELENKRVVASYNTSKGKVYIIKEEGHKITTVLFAYEY